MFPPPKFNGPPKGVGISKETVSTYNLLRKLPASLAGFYHKERRFHLGRTSLRLFVLKSEYLICYDKKVSQDLLSRNYSDLRDVVEESNKRSIKRVIRLCKSTFYMRTLHNSQFSAYIQITEKENRPLIIFYKTVDEADIWLSLLENSCVSISTSDFEVMGELGQGSFGKVELVRYLSSGQLFAMKTVELRSETSSLLNQFVEERTIMQKLRHCGYIVQLKMAFREGNCLYYVMDYCEKGDLFALIQTRGKLQEDEAIAILARITLAIGYMHRLHVLHRDIKPENILITEQEGAKLADFGLSKCVASMKSRTFSCCGTDLYRPPEMGQNGTGHTRAVDWWQLGCVLYEMLVGTPPFRGTKEERRRQVLGGEPEFPPFLSLSSVDLIRKLLMKNSWERLGSGDGDVEDVKAHPFFRNVDWEELVEKGKPRDEADTTPTTPTPLRPQHSYHSRSGTLLVNEEDLLGFEFDERIVSEVFRRMSSYIKTQQCCIAVPDLSFLSTYLCLLESLSFSSLEAMGNNQAKIGIRQKELKELQEETKFTANEIITLYDAFKNISSSRVDDGVIDEQEFRSLVGMKEGFFFERVFALFDKNNDGQIAFIEFVKCLSCLTSRSTEETRQRFIFKFYDLKQDNVISRDELRRITEAMFFQYGKTIDDAMLDSIVEETFRLLGIEKDQTMDFDSFCKIPGISNPIIEMPALLSE